MDERMKHNPLSHQTVSLQSFNHGVVRVLVQHQSVLHVLHEVQVFECGLGLLPLLLGRSPLVGGALQVVFEVHADHAGQHVVHDNHADVLPARLDAVEAEKLGQQRTRVLIQVLEESRLDRGSKKKKMGDAFVLEDR